MVGGGRWAVSQDGALEYICLVRSSYSYIGGGSGQWAARQVSTTYGVSGFKFKSVPNASTRGLQDMESKQRPQMLEQIHSCPV